MVNIQDIREKELAYCRSNIDYFVDTYGHIEDKDADDLIQPFSMWREQRDALHSLMKHKWNVILKARQLGFFSVSVAYSSALPDKSGQDSHRVVKNGRGSERACTPFERDLYVYA